MNSKYLTTVNLDPFLKGAIGVNSHFADMLNRCENANTGNYPPYNIIEVDEDHYIVELAIAGFEKDEVDVTVENGTLIVESVHTAEPYDEDVTEPNYIHHGISSRAFKRMWQLADHVEVTGAAIQNGILTIGLTRKVPEALQPKKIEIK